MRKQAKRKTRRRRRVLGEYRVRVEYHGYDNAYDRLLGKLAGAPSTGTGYSFTEDTRDLEWACRTLRQARRVAKALKKAKTGLRVSIFGPHALEL